MSTGKIIKELRTEAGLLQSELSQIIGCSSQVISNIERDYSKPSAEIVNRCAAYFGVPADYILGRTTVHYSTGTNTYCSPLLSSRITDRMTQLQMSASDLLERVEISEEYFNDILSEKVLPNIDIAARLSTALHTSIDYLIGNSEYSCTIASEDEQDIIFAFRSMSKREKRLFLADMEEIKK